MKFKICNTDFSVSFPAVAFFTIALLCDTQGKVLMCLIASVLHEAGHLLAMKYFGVRIRSFSLNLGDIAINSENRNLMFSQEIIVSSSGVAVNLLCFLLSWTLWQIFNFAVFRDFAIINACIGVFNILPVRFLDGGQIVFSIMERYFSFRRASLIINILTVLFLVPVAVAGFMFLFVSKYNYSLLFASLYLICTLISKELR